MLTSTGAVGFSVLVGCGIARRTQDDRGAMAVALASRFWRLWMFQNLSRGGDMLVVDLCMKELSVVYLSVVNTAAIFTSRLHS